MRTLKLQVIFALADWIPKHAASLIKKTAIVDLLYILLVDFLCLRVLLFHAELRDPPPPHTHTHTQATGLYGATHCAHLPSPYLPGVVVTVLKEPWLIGAVHKLMTILCYFNLGSLRVEHQRASQMHVFACFSP